MFFISSCVVSVLAYGFHLFAARFLSIGDYGSLQALISLQNIMLIPVLILATILTRIMAEYKRDNLKQESLIFRINLRKRFIFPGILLLPLFFIFIPFLEKFLNIEATGFFVLLGIYFYLSFFQCLDSSFLNGWHKFGQSNLSTLANGVFKFILGIFFMSVGYGVLGGLLGITFGLLVHIIINIFFIAYNFSKDRTDKNKIVNIKIDSYRIKYLISYTYPIIMGIGAINILSNADLLIAKHHFNSMDAGKYGALFILSKIIFFAVSSLAAIVVPIVVAEKDFQKKKLYFLWIMGVNFIIAGLGVLFFYLFPNLVISILFGEKYLDISSYLFKFGLLAMLLSMLNIFIQYFISLKCKKILCVLAVLSFLEIITLWFWGRSFEEFFIIILSTLLGALILSGLYFLGYFSKDKFLALFEEENIQV